MVGRAVKRLAEEVQQLTGRSVELAYVIRATLVRPQPTRRALRVSLAQDTTGHKLALTP